MRGIKFRAWARRIYYKIFLYVSKKTNEDKELLKRGGE